MDKQSDSTWAPLRSHRLELSTDDNETDDELEVDHEHQQQEEGEVSTRSAASRC